MTEKRTRVFTGMHGNDLMADCWGAPDGPAVLFLHGGGQTRHAWGGTAVLMAAAGWHAISVDLRGHGESAWTEQYQRMDFGGDVIEIVKQLGSEPMLVGASLGGN